MEDSFPSMSIFNNFGNSFVQPKEILKVTTQEKLAQFCHLCIMEVKFHAGVD